MSNPFRATGGVLRVIAAGPTFEGMLDLSVDEIRQNAGGNVSVLARLITMLRHVGRQAPTPARRRLVDVKLGLVAEAAERSVEAPYDRAQLRAMATAGSADAPHSQ